MFIWYDFFSNFIKELFYTSAGVFRFPSLSLAFFFVFFASVIILSFFKTKICSYFVRNYLKWPQDKIKYLFDDIFAFFYNFLSSWYWFFWAIRDGPHLNWWYRLYSLLVKEGTKLEKNINLSIFSVFIK